MAWGTVEAEPEVTEWFEGLDDDRFGQAERYVDLLAEEGVHLSEPFTRQLDGKLRELRFHLERQQIRITYYIASGRRIVLLTVFAKTRQRERLRSPGRYARWRAASPKVTPLRSTHDQANELGRHQGGAAGQPAASPRL